MCRISRCAAIGLMAVMVGATPTFAQTFSSGSTGADGAFTPPAGLTTLTLPPSGVFNFTTVTIGGSSTVKFTRNATNTPVTILATGNVAIGGVIDISGAFGGVVRFNSTIIGGNGGPGGPGGFDGGSGAAALVSPIGGAGLGAGGGTGSNGQSGGGAGGGGHLVAGAAGAGTGAGEGGTAYGIPSLLPLVGGSGGGGGGAVGANSGGGGGGGGGALLIASSGTISLGGQIQAQAGNGANATGPGVNAGGGGSGGAVRLIASTITGTTGLVNVAGGLGGAGAAGTAAGNGSAGRVRIEAFTNSVAVNVGTSTFGVLSSGTPSSVTLPNAPSLRITAVGGVPSPAAPSGSFTVADVVLPSTTSNPVTVSLAAANIPVGTTVTVTVKGLYDAASSTPSTPLAGSTASSTASAAVSIPTNEPAVIGAFASFLLASVTGGAPVYVDGEEVERVRVTAAPGGPSTAAYVTRAGREISISAAR